MTVFKAFQPTDLAPTTIRIALEDANSGTVVAATGKEFEIRGRSV
jgi:hypothetical protein